MVVPVGDVAQSLGEEGIGDLDAFERDRPALARDLCDAGDLVDQLVRVACAHREREAHTDRQAVQDDGKRKADHRRGGRAAEDHDHCLDVAIGLEVAAIEHDQADAHTDAGEKPMPVAGSMTAPRRSDHPDKRCRNAETWINDNDQLLKEALRLTACPLRPFG